MKCISLWQPWAALVVLGEKEFETRSWPTHIRGRIAIHAAKKWTRELARLCRTLAFYEALEAKGYNPLEAKRELDFGAIIGSVEIINCVETNVRLRGDLSSREKCFGDYSDNRYAWKLDLPIHYAEPIPFRGSQGFFEISDPAQMTREMIER